MKLYLFTLAVLYVAVPFFVGISREWTPRLRPRGFVFTIFLHGILFAAAYTYKMRDHDFLLNVLIICWWNLTLYGAGRLFTVFVQGRFMNWIDSLTPEQQLARVLIVGTILLLGYMPAKEKILRESRRDPVSFQRSIGFLPFEIAKSQTGRMPASLDR